MASGLSKRYISALWNQQSVGIAFAGNTYALNRRRYTTTPTTHKQKTYSSARTTSKTTTSKSASTPSVLTKSSATSRVAPAPKGAMKREDSSASSKAISPVSAPVHQMKTAPSVPDKNRTRFNRTTGGMAYKVPEKGESKTMTEEEQIETVEKVMAMAKLFPTADPWGQAVETLDVQIPYSVKFSARKNYPSLRAMFNQFLENRYNDAKNATSLLLLAQADAIPGVDLSEATRIQTFITQWPWRIFTTTSVKPDAWIASLRQTALSTYQQLNAALARQHSTTVKKLSTHTYQDQLLRLMKKNQPGVKYIWRFHRELSPTRVISIRASEGYLAAEDPKFGNRMMIHALVRIDSEQSLEMYDMWGKPMHRPATGDGVAKLASMSGYGNWPSERKRVTEYLVFEKRMWYDGPWAVREQLWEAPGKEANL
ncbi:hypothetical protein L208DRAFT_1412543 [Tricholoma matsutake]|nr:hypothetical protein L208DRAFT_1412543 [Tricholoma matsutake 945]